MNQKINFLFFGPDIKTTSSLDPIDAVHCVRVLRKTSGDVIHVTDGLGALYVCEIISDNPKNCKIRIVEEIQDYNPINRKIHLAICPTKSADRMEYFVEKSVEIGVSSIQFVLSQNTYPKKVNLERMNKIAISAMKQSIKTHKPSIFEPLKFEKFISSSLNIKSKFIAHLDFEAKNITSFKMEDEVLMLIGPEGDFTKEEIHLAKNNNFEAIYMGKSRLRTETAGIVAVSLLNLLS